MQAVGGLVGFGAGAAVLPLLLWFLFFLFFSFTYLVHYIKAGGHTALRTHFLLRWHRSFYASVAINLNT